MIAKVQLDRLFQYFPNLTDAQRMQFAALNDLYQDWNAKINLISRKDIENLYEKHVLHALGIAKVTQFKAGSHVLDVGCGGGFPGLPLAILMPEVQFALVDSIGKKIKVVDALVDSLKLNNVKTQVIRAEQIKEKFDFVVSRAVTELPTFVQWVKDSFKKTHNNVYPNGIFYLKGGDLKQELAAIHRPYEVFNLQEYFCEDFFLEKKVVYVPFY